MSMLDITVTSIYHYAWDIPGPIFLSGAQAYGKSS